MKKEESKKANKGITLIALVITVIVLLILAGVSIATLTGDNGILKKAQNAKDLTNQKTAEEEVQIEVLGSLDNSGNINIEDLNSNLLSHLSGVNYKEQPLSAENKIETLPAVVEYNGYKILISGDTSTSLGDALKPGEEAKETKKYNYTDGVDVATIPEGFAVSEEKEEQKIANGLVIKNDGNEFVWIPCTITQYQNAKNAVKRNEWSHQTEYYTNGGEDGSAWSDDYTVQDISNINAVYETNGVDNTTISPITSSWENKQTEVAEESIRKYGGFYIARYEAGIPSTATFYTEPNSEGEGLKYKQDGGIRGTTNNEGLTSVKGLSPVSKKGVQAWNCITQPNSKIVAENMYKASSEETSVGSYLVDLQAWNHICENIYGANANKTGKSITDSSTWGNYYDNNSVYEKDIEGLWAQHAYTTTWVYAPNYKKGPVTAKAGGDQNTELGGTNQIELPTGASEDFKNYNIYDMAGNMWEWTTGHNINSETMYVVPRGR